MTWIEFGGLICGILAGERGSSFSLESKTANARLALTQIKFIEQ